MLGSTCLVFFGVAVVLVAGVNRAPSFESPDGDLSDFALSENTPIGSIVYRLKGYDPERGSVFYSISGPEFTVDSRTGYVQLQRQLDREKQPELDVIVTIRDESFEGLEPNIVSVRRVVRVLDENDNRPRFLNGPYSGTISETARFGTFVRFGDTDTDIIVSDSDAGRNAELHVTCHSNGTFNSCDIFEVVAAGPSNTCQTECVIRVQLKSKLDYETRVAYELYVKVSDRGRNQFTVFEPVRISVRDEQDEPPVFLNAPYTVTVSENLPPDTEVLAIVASDGDRTRKRPIYLEIEDDPLNLFYLNVSARTDDEILLMTSEASARLLDREHAEIVRSNGVYRVAIRATEIVDEAGDLGDDFVRETVTIVVTDVDDQRAEFDKDFYEVIVPENLAELSLVPNLKMSVRDRDLEPNNRFNLTIAGTAGVFGLVPDHGEGHVLCRLRLLNGSSLDVDNGAGESQIEFDIVASSGSVSSRARVRIRVTDVNDNRPVFERKEYRFEIDENVAVGTEVGRVHASDRDSGLNGLVFYELLDSGQDEFEIERLNGSIRVKRSPDYETRGVYDLIVQARDGNGQGSQRPAAVQILIRNVNDNAPRFEQSHYYRLVPEKSSEFRPQFFIRARDIDLEQNATIRYTLLALNSERADVFRLDRETGELRINKALRANDTLSGQYELQVQATDFGYPPLSNTTTVRVRVGVAGNQRPIFKANSIGKNGRLEYRVDVDETVSSGTVVLNVSAIDPDTFVPSAHERSTGSLTFEIVDGDFDRFTIDSRTGVLSVADGASLDLSEPGSKAAYSLLIQVADGAEPRPETSTIPVQIQIRDLNNKPPKFLENHEDFLTVSETAEPGTILATVQARDPDSHSVIRYEITAPPTILDRNGNEAAIETGQKLLEIDETTGAIRLLRKLPQDLERISQIHLRIRASDKNATNSSTPQQDFKDLTIYVRRPQTDRSQPIFLHDNWSSESPVIRCNCDEELPIGTVIFKLMAFDPLNNRSIDNFRAVSAPNSATDQFSVSANGTVFLAKRLDYEHLGDTDRLELLVAALAAPSRSTTTTATTTLEIFVNNLNDNKPVFEQQDYFRKVPESLAHGEEILTVRAVDADLPRFVNERNRGTQRFGLVTYSILLNYDNKFEINATTGLLQLKRGMKLDRETDAEIELIVQASDNGLAERKSEASVRLEISDVNDNRPDFEREEFVAVVSELEAIGTGVLNVTARDPDTGAGGVLAYSLSENSFLEIDRGTGEIRTKRLLNGKGRKEPYRLRLKVEDGLGLSSESSLLVYVADVAENDGVPEIVRPRANETIDVLENSEVGSVIYRVQAEDADSADTLNGQLVYRLDPSGVDHKCFEIDLFTGLLRIKCQFDRELRSAYTFGLEVSDRGHPARKSTRIVHVRIADADDNSPIFPKNIDNDEPVVFEIDEEVPVNSSIGEITAIDADAPENSRVYFAIRGGNEKGLVRLDRKANETHTGVLRVAGRIDREQLSELLLTVKCSRSELSGGGGDRSFAAKYDPKDRSEIQVRIRINDLDDNLPFFAQPTRHTLAIGSKTATLTLVETFQAFDRDLRQSTNFSYRLKECRFSPKHRDDLLALQTFNTSVAASSSKPVDDCRDNFVLDAKRGSLRTAKNLKVYNNGHFNVTVEASNGQSTVRSLIILVLNEKNLLRFVYNNGNEPQQFERIRDAISKRLGAALETVKLRRTSVPEPGTLVAPARLQSAHRECFQLVDNGTSLLTEVETIELLANSDEFERIRNEFNISHLEMCYRSGSIIQKEISFAQSMLLVTAAAIALVCFVLFHLLLFMSRRLANKSF